MFKKILLPLTLLLVISCSKENETQPPTPIVTTFDIHHFDWVPNTIITDSIRLDLNSDNNFDLEFKLTATYQGSTPSGGPYYNYSSNIISLDSNLLISLGTKLPPSSSSYDPWDCLEFNDMISENLTWERSFRLNYSVIYAGDVGTWDINKNEGYVALKFNTAQKNKWGWIKLTSTSSNIILKEYVINENLNQPIFAGQIK